MAVWVAPTNKNDTAIIAGPTMNQTLALGTPAAHSVLICIVAWTGVIVSGIVTDTRNNVWVSTPAINNGSNYCQLWYCLNANGAGTVTITFATSNNVTNVQLAAAEYPLAIATTQSAAPFLSIDRHTATGTSTAPTSGTTQSAPPYPDSLLWIGYGDVGASSAWAATNSFTLRSAAAARRAGLADIVNGNGYTPWGAIFTTSNLAWTCGVAVFGYTSVGAAIGLPIIDVVARQGQLVAGTNPRFGTPTAPMGSAGGALAGGGIGQLYPTGRN